MQPAWKSRPRQLVSRERQERVSHLLGGAKGASFRAAAQLNRSKEENMRTKSPIITLVLAAVLIALFATGGTIAQRSRAKGKKVQEAKITTLEMLISKDGRSIVDQNGNIIARFVEGMRVQMQAPAADADNQKMAAQGVGNEAAKTNAVSADSQKMKGCLRCHPECVIYDRNGVCVRYVQSCTWDFDC